MGVARYLAAATPARLASGGIGVGIPILSVQVEGDVALGGALVAAALAPSIVAAPLVGVILDRTPHPRAWMAAGGAALAVGYGLVAALGLLPLPVVIAALVLAGAMTPFLMGGMSSFVTEEVPDERRAYAIDALSYNVGAVAGPALVALAIAVSSARVALLVLSGVALAGTVATLVTRLRPLAVGGGSLLGTMGRGLRHLLTHRPIAVVTTSGTLSQLGNGGLAIAAVALSIERAGSPDEAAVIVAAFAIGGLVGALAATVRRSRMRPELIMAFGFAATGLLTAAAAVDLGLIGAVLLIGASGLFTASSSAAMLLLRKQQSPTAVRSQVFTIGSALRATAAAAGAATAGALAGLGAAALVLGVATVWVLSAVVMAAYPRGAAALDDA